MKNEMGSMKAILSDISNVVKAQSSVHPTPAPSIPQESRPSQVEEDVRPSGPRLADEEVRPTRPNSEETAGPSGPEVVVEDRPSGPAEDVSRPLGLVDSKAIPVRAEEKVVAPEPFPGSISPSPTIFQNLSLLDSMAASGSSGSVGGYCVLFLMTDQQERYSEVKIKLCGNKVVDLADLEKHEMHSMVEALQKLKWTGICTASEPSYPHLAKAFYTCLKTEEDSSLTSTVKDLKGELMEKMGQPIRSRNLKKSGFSLIGNVWTKTSVAESEAIIGEVPEDPLVQEEEAAVREEEPPAPERRIEDIAPELFEPIGQSIKVIVPPTVPAPAFVEEVFAEGAAQFEGKLEDMDILETPNVLEVEAALKESHEDTVAEVVAPGHTEDVQTIDAPAQGELEKTYASAPADQFQEGLVESTSDDDVVPAVGSEGRSKGVAPKVPLLTRKAHHRSRKKKIHVHIKPVIARLNAHGEILCSLQSDISSIFISQSTGAKEIGAVNSELQEMRSELGSLKQLVTDLSDFVRVHLSAPAPPALNQSMSETPAPSSPPTSFTAPPAPETLKKPLPKHISSPTPFPTATSSSPPSSSSIPHPTSEAPPASSSSAGPSSTGPSSTGPSTQPPTSTFSSFHLPTPPSFITIIPEAASVIPHSVHDIKDEFEEAILRTVLVISAHLHRTDSQPSSSPTYKRRKTSSAHVFPSNQTLFPPLWYSLSVVNRRRTLHAEYLQKCTFAATFGLPYLNLSEHLNIFLPTSGLPKAEQAKILSTNESKTEDQWAKANKALYRKFEVARINIFPPKDHPLTLSEWFVYQHRDSWGPFIQKKRSNSSGTSKCTKIIVLSIACQRSSLVNSEKP
ncbi:hypothetical protein Taro_028692 [Colocasia esculenta]|uniref:Uncharacterized protein n=1 Tax=Colocasia esculenta TaxID=4460 RepID=A0A843VHW6_COLES|nr:hypothetical protein [Colocasia esculenta]